MVLASTKPLVSMAVGSATDVMHASPVDVLMRFLLLHELPKRF